MLLDKCIDLGTSFSEVGPHPTHSPLAFIPEGFSILNSPPQKHKREGKRTRESASVNVKCIIWRFILVNRPDFSAAPAASCILVNLQTSESNFSEVILHSLLPKKILFKVTNIDSTTASQPTCAVPAQISGHIRSISYCFQVQPVTISTSFSSSCLKQGTIL